LRIVCARDALHSSRPQAGPKVWQVSWLLDLCNILALRFRSAARPHLMHAWVRPGVLDQEAPGESSVYENLSEAAKAVGRYKRQAEQLLLDATQCQPGMRLGLMTTLYFRQGHCESVRRRVDACFVQFYEAFSPLLRWQSYIRPRKLSPSGFSICRRQVLEAGNDEPVEWSLSSAAASEAASHGLALTGTSAGQARTDQSCLKMLLPWSLLTEHGGIKVYEGWLKYLCNQTGAEHGYGGPVCVLPGGQPGALSLEFRLASDYPGLIVDAGPHMESLRLFDRIKGVSWYTVLGAGYVERLGGNDRLRGSLSAHHDVIFQTYDQGLMIRAGVLPDLGGKGEPLSSAYIAVNKVIRPVRVRDTGCLHPCPVRGAAFTEQSTAQWYARFDEKPVAPVRAGQPCPQSGHWFSNARARSRRFFSKGEVMPAFEHVNAERTQWFWAEVSR
jgi:hypothetical protein